MMKLIAALLTAVLLVFLARATLHDNDPQEGCSKHWVICPPGVYAIADAPLRSAVEDLESRTIGYDEKTALASSTNVIQLWGASQRVSAFLERYERRSGQDAAVELARVVEPIYKTLLNKLEWIDGVEQREAWLLSCFEDIRAAHNRLIPSDEARRAINARPAVVTFQK
jgi:hypothetical protein